MASPCCRARTFVRALTALSARPTAMLWVFLLATTGCAVGNGENSAFGRRQGIDAQLSDAGQGTAWNAATALRRHRAHKRDVHAAEKRWRGAGVSAAAQDRHRTIAGVVEMSPTFGDVLRTLDGGSWQTLDSAQTEAFWTKPEMRQVNRRKTETYKRSVERYSKRLKPLYGHWECSILRASYHPCFYQGFDDFNKRWTAAVGGSMADIVATGIGKGRAPASGMPVRNR